MRSIAPLLDDFRSAGRSLGHRPGFTAVAVLTLTVALGANTVVFSVLEQTLLRPLPFEDADRLVYLFRQNEAQGFRVTPTLAQVRTWREGARSLETVEPFHGTRVTLLGRGDPRRLEAARVAPGLFGLLGVRPLLGGGLSGDSGPESGHRVVLGHHLWRELFGGSADALGSSLRLDDGLYTVAGVLGPELRSLPPLGEVDLWLLLGTDAVEEADRTSVYALGRLASHASAASAAAEVLALERHRAGNAAVAQWRPEVIHPVDLFGQFLGRAVLALQAAVVLILLIGCANVGNLFLVRAAGRRHEIAVRTALGASRGRIARTLVLESLLIAGSGAGLGLALAVLGGRAVIGIHDWPLLDLHGVRLDPGLFAFSAGAALLATLAFGLVPAMTASRADPGGALRAGAPGTGGGSASGRGRSLLAVGEIALSLVLLVGAGLLTKHFVSLLRTDPGFVVEGLVAVSVELPEARYASPESQAAFLRSLRAGLASLDLDVALASAAPPHAGITFGQLQTEGSPAPPSDAPADNLGFVAVTPGYFRTLGLPVLEGRPLLERDFAGTEQASGGEEAVLVNRPLAARLWPGESPLGRRFRLGTTPDRPWLRVVGVAGESTQLGLRGGFPFQLYTTLRRNDSFAVLLRTGAARDAAVDRVEARIHAVDPALPVRSVRSVGELLRADLAAPRFQAFLMLAFAGTALALAGLGVYAVLAYAVRRRSFEIGVRIALGALPSQVLALVGRQLMTLALGGLGLGAATALVLTRLLGHLLGDVSPRDPGVYAAAAAILLATCTLAALFPAVRAARVDPARVLREE